MATSNYRSRKHLDLAHRVNVCQGCGRWVEGCEPAHGNEAKYGKGGAMKAHDCFHAALCHDCHAELDHGNKWTRDEKRAFFERALLATTVLYFLNGWLKVA